MTHTHQCIYLSNNHFEIAWSEQADTPDQEIEKLKKIQSGNLRFHFFRNSHSQSIFQSETEALQYLQNRCTALQSSLSGSFWGWMRSAKDRFLQQFSQACAERINELSHRQMTLQRKDGTLFPEEVTHYMLSQFNITTLLKVGRLNTTFNRLANDVLERRPQMLVFKAAGIKYALRSIVYCCGHYAHGHNLSRLTEIIRKKDITPILSVYSTPHIELLLNRIPSLTTKEIFLIVTNEKVSTPIFCAYMNSLLKKNEIVISPDPTIQQDLQTALLQAIDNGYFHLTELLIRLGADPNSIIEQNPDNSPLVRAARCGYYRIVELLLQLSPTTFPVHVLTAAINSTLPQDKFFIDTATFKVLLQYIVSKKYISRNCLESTSCRILSHMSKTLEVFTPLFDAGALSLFTVLRQDPRHWGVEVVRFLLDKGVPVNATEAFGLTALHRAAFGNHTSIIELLLERGADPTLRDELGRTPLDIAQSKGNTAIIPLLEAAQKKKEQPPAEDPVQALERQVKAQQERIAQLERELLRTQQDKEFLESSNTDYEKENKALREKKS